MLNTIPFWLSFLFIIITLLTTALIYFIIIQSKVSATRNKAIFILYGVVGWLAIQLLLTIFGVYSNYIITFPPLIFIFGILPILVAIIWLFVSKKGKEFIATLPLEYLTNLHFIRIFIEFILLFLFWQNAIPKAMTFEGNNYDIIIGISAPIISFLFFKQKFISRKVLLVWNCIGLIFLLHIAIVGILSTPSAIQQINFAQPNKAVLFFPFSWLITFIVPVMLTAHIISIVRLLKPKQESISPTMSEFYNL